MELAAEPISERFDYRPPRGNPASWLRTVRRVHGAE
ncbi:YfdQ family protein [Nitrosomonas sp. Nm34]|nr:YfdQ family protein [Nitrosomonas sp. Nm34]